jgi:hypothetical protein
MTIKRAKFVFAAFLVTILTGMSVLAAAPARQCAEQAQADAKAPGGGPDEGPDLAKVLRACDQTRNQIQSLHGIYKITHLDHVLCRQSVSQAEVWYVRPDFLRIDLHSNQPQRTVLICTKNELTSLDFDHERQHVCDRAATIKSRPESGFFAGLFWLAEGGFELEMEDRWRQAILGMNMEEAANRFKVSIAKQDQNYVFLSLTPRLAQDRLDLAGLYLALDKKSYQVSAALFREPSGNEVKVESTKIELNPQPPIKPEAVLKDMPKGWMTYKSPSSR